VYTPASVVTCWVKGCFGQSFCPACQTDRDHRVVTNMGVSHAQHIQLKFLSESEQFLSFKMHFLSWTDKRTCLNGSNPPGECKMWCSDEIISFWHPDRHTHTHTRVGRGYAFLSACPCLKVITSWTKSIKWPKSPDRHRHTHTQGKTYTSSHETRAVKIHKTRADKVQQ